MDKENENGENSFLSESEYIKKIEEDYNRLKSNYKYHSPDKSAEDTLDNKISHIWNSLITPLYGYISFFENSNDPRYEKMHPVAKEGMKKNQLSRELARKLISKAIEMIRADFENDGLKIIEEEWRKQKDTLATLLGKNEKPWDPFNNGRKLH